MYVMRLDANGTLDLTIPDLEEEVLQLGDAYVRHEESLEASQRLIFPSMEDMKLALEATRGASGSASQGEIQRSGSAEDFRQTLEQAREKGNLAIQRLKGKYAENLANLEGWGLQTKRNSRGAVTVQKPKGDRQWVKFLEAYVAKERGLAPEQRITDPVLEELEQISEEASRQLKSRDHGFKQRIIGNSTLSEAALELRGLLQLAAHALMVTRYKGQVAQELRSWSFQVTSRAGSSPTKAAGTPATGTEAAGTPAAGTPAAGTPAAGT